MIAIGSTYQVEKTVSDTLTALAVGSGTLPVLGTPCLAAALEQAATACIQSALEPQLTSVGTQLDLSHLSPTPVGMKFWAEATVTAVSENGRLVTFALRAWDERGPIGEGTHQRAIIHGEKFLAKCQAKL